MVNSLCIPATPCKKRYLDMTCGEHGKLCDKCKREEKKDG